MSLKSILESLIFASEKPLTVKQLKSLTGGTAAETIRAAVKELEEDYSERGVNLVQLSGGYLFRTSPDNADWVRKLLTGRPPRVTPAMLETLAIVAYRQPVTRPELEDIRGVDSGGVLRVLLQRRLVRIVGKKEEPGRPLLYGTTKQFLEFFNLKDLKDLPTLKEFTELSEEHADRVDTEYGAAPEPPEPTEEEASADMLPEPEPEALVEEVDVDQDKALEALNRAMDRIKKVDREHRKAEKARVQAQAEAEEAERQAKAAQAEGGEQQAQGEGDGQ